MADKSRKPLRILMTADAMGGVWTYALALIKQLEPFGIQVALATMGDRLGLRQRQELAAFPQVTLYESSYKLEWMENPWEEVKAAGEWLLQINEEFQPDLIHLNNYAHGSLDWGKPVVMVMHSCVGSWWKAVKGEVAPPHWNYYQHIVGQGLQAADVVVAPSAAMLQDALQLYGPFNQTKVIYNGQNTGKFNNNTKEPFIFSMGRVWDDAKNIKLLAQLGAELEWPVYIAGEARHPVTGDTQLLPNVHYLGTLPEAEIIQWLGRAGIFCLPAKYEPFGLAILEAALSGCALVLGNIPSLREIWGPTAAYVNPDDGEALKTTLASLIADEFTRTRMGFLARQKGMQYSIEQTAFAYRDIYNRLKAEAKPGKSKKKILM